jgi:peptidyl-prolyl cis-trans isomerase SDCCAG10
MSNIYNLEPQAHGLIVFKTTFGDLELELFTKQCPKNTKNFVQLCLDGYYEGSIFDRIEKDFIAIGGEHADPGFDTLETEIVPDEFHQRLKFTRRGLLATANTEKNVNGPKFFFTLGPAPELQNKHTIFGRLKGNSIYHIVDLNDCQVDDEMRPVSEKKIMQVIVEDNPYPELGVRPHFQEKLKRLRTVEHKDSSDDEYLEPKPDIKNSKKLSFYEDSDSDDDDGDDAHEAAHSGEFKVPNAPDASDCGNSNNDSVKNDNTSASPRSGDQDSRSGQKSTADEEAREKKLREIREQIKELKKKLENESATKIRTLSDRKRESQEHGSPLNVTQESKANSSKQSSIEDSSTESRLAMKKGRHRERQTIERMQQFKKRLKDAASKSSHRSISNTEIDLNRDEQYLDGEGSELALDLVDGDDWLSHRFDAKDTTDSPEKDVSTKGDDWYSLDDPISDHESRDSIDTKEERVESERAREYRRHKERDRHREDRDRHRDDRDQERRHRHSHRSSRDHRR